MNQKQISDLIKMAKEQIIFCEEIVNYPEKMGKQNYEVAIPINNFYKNTCNAFFGNCVLIVSSLLSRGDKNRNTINFYNLEKFIKHKEKKLNLNNQIKKFNKHFKLIRNQIIAHQDQRNNNNKIINLRGRAIIDKRHIILLSAILDKIIQEFCNYATEPTMIYNPKYFSGTAREEINQVLKNAKLILTDLPVLS
ncbi:hypothetical protein KAI52_00465 [Candidatus Parcubacteria bacterium]|nr:hypothetical protein [Candidatus Parcubacteria bacterium]